MTLCCVSVLLCLSVPLTRTNVLADCLNDQILCTTACAGGDDLNCPNRCFSQAQACLARERGVGGSSTGNDVIVDHYDPPVVNYPPTRLNVPSSEGSSPANGRRCTKMDQYISAGQSFPEGEGHCAGKKVVSLTNNSSQTVVCWVYLTEEQRAQGVMSEITIRSGQTTDAGLWTCGARRGSSAGFWCVLDGEEMCLPKIAR